MAANYNLITAAIPGHSGRYSRDSGRSPVLQMTNDPQLLCFLANSFERMPSAALREHAGTASRASLLVTLPLATGGGILGLRIMLKPNQSQ